MQQGIEIEIFKIFSNSISHYCRFLLSFHLLARAAGSAANAAMEKLKDPGGGNILSPGDIKKGGGLCPCILSMSSSCDALK